MGRDPGRLPDITVDQGLRRVLQIIRKHATYSVGRQKWILPTWQAHVVILEHMVHLPPELGTVQAMLEEGARRKLWELDQDEETETGSVLIR